MKQHNFGQLVSGRSTGLKAHIFRFFLRVISQIYQIAAVSRNFLYSGGWLKTHHVDAVVISIGNITTGGTGKTPLVIWLCRFLQQKDLRYAVLTRGYKTRGTSNEERATMDEPAILAESCQQTKVIINPNRVEAAAEAVGKFGAEVLIMDDGFQHRRLHRDLDIVTIDGTCPFGYGRVLPAGLLREPVVSLKRADAAVLTRCDQIPESESSQIEKKLQLINPDMVIAKSIHNPICAEFTAGEKITLEQLRSRNIFAFCGIGNPNSFLNTIINIGANLVGSKIYNDHHCYTDRDIYDIHEQAKCLRADLILSTQKDHTHYAMIATQYDIPFAYLAVEIKFIAGEDRLKQLIEDTLAGKIHK